MTKTKLPSNWRIGEMEMYGGTGFGDEKFGYPLLRWQQYTTGHWWWKKTHWGWVRKGIYDDREVATDYAIQTEQMIQETAEAA